MSRSTPEFTYLSLTDAAHVVGVDKRTVRRWIADGWLPAYRVGGKLFRVRSDELDAMFRRVPAVSK